MRNPSELGRVFALLLIVAVIPAHAQVASHRAVAVPEAPGAPKPRPWKPIEERMIFHKQGAMWFQLPNPKAAKGEKLTYVETVALCQKYGLRLPTRQDVEAARAELEIADAKLMRHERDFWITYTPEGEKFSRMLLASNFGLNLGYKYLAVSSGVYDTMRAGELVRCVYDAAAPVEPTVPSPNDLATEVRPSMK